MPKWEKPFLRNLPSFLFFQTILEYELISFLYCLKHKKGSSSRMLSWALKFTRSLSIAYLFLLLFTFSQRGWGPRPHKTYTGVLVCTCKLTYTYVGTSAHLMLVRALGKCFAVRKAPCQFLREARFLPAEKKISHQRALCDIMDIVLNNSCWILVAYAFCISLS